MQQLIQDNLNIILPPFIVFVLSLIEVSKIQINPWSFLAKYVFKPLFGVNKIEDRFTEIDKKFEKMDSKLNAIDIKFDQKIFSLKKGSAEAEVVELRGKIFEYRARLENGVTFDDEEEEEIYRIIKRYTDITNHFQIENSHCDDAVYAIRNLVRHPEIFMDKEDENAISDTHL